jgi:16S rRNA (adenine(1408)-N(1))-methyltransferase
VLVLHGRSTETLDDAEVERRLTTAERVVIDVGTGDAKWAYRQARAEPTALVIGLDPARDRMREMATRVARKPARGGVDNLLLVPAPVEQADPLLRGRADSLHVLLPWGSLLRAVVLGEPTGLAALRALAKAGASVEVVVGTDVWDDPVPLDARDLPEVTTGYGRDTLAPRYEAAGLPIDDVHQLTDEEWRALASTWARRLADNRRQPKFVRILATAR